MFENPDISNEIQKVYLSNNSVNRWNQGNTCSSPYISNIQISNTHLTLYLNSTRIGLSVRFHNEIQRVLIPGNDIL